MLIHPLLSITTTTTTTVTAPATTSPVTSTYRMEEPDTPLTSHTNQSPGRHSRNKRLPSGQPRHPRPPKNNPEPSKDNSQSKSLPKSDTAGGRATPSTPRSASPGDKGNDSSASHTHRKNKPNPKSRSIPSTKESGDNPARVKPPQNTSDYLQRRDQKKPDGGTTDASDPKPPRRENKTARRHKEPKVDSESIRDSEDPEPSSLRQRPPRQKRRGKFDGKLTTGDAEPPQEERRVNTKRGEYWVDYSADDLTSRLIHDLRTPPFLDCAICYNPIRPHQPTWSCSPNTPAIPTEGSQQAQYCWTTLHLKCVRSWASKSIADVRQAYEARGENKPGEWLCIGCRAKRMVEPTLYRCAHR